MAFRDNCSPIWPSRGVKDAVLPLCFPPPAGAPFLFLDNIQNAGELTVHQLKTKTLDTTTGAGLVD